MHFSAHGLGLAVWGICMVSSWPAVGPTLKHAVSITETTSRPSFLLVALFDHDSTGSTNMDVWSDVVTCRTGTKAGKMYQTSQSRTGLATCFKWEDTHQYQVHPIEFRKYLTESKIELNRCHHN